MNYEFNEEEPFSPDDFPDEKERKKRIKEEKKRQRKLKFSDKKPSKAALLADWLALLALILMIISIIVSATCEGNAGIAVGTTAIFALLATVVGVIASVKSFRETDIILKYSWIGVIANGILFIFIAFVTVSGI